MRLLEIKNNLVKLFYENDEHVIMGKFIVLMSEGLSYVAQIVNMKCDLKSSIVIAKLIFTFNSEGVVDNYDGSQPDINSSVSNLNTSELLSLLPVERPIRIGNLAQEQNELTLDLSIFENNFTVFSDSDLITKNLMTNFVSNVFLQKEKSVIIDNRNLFDGFEKVQFGKDFKIPLNIRLIDYLFDKELMDVDVNTKAIIKDIFYSVQQYLKTLKYEFIPIDNFVDVVSNQYKETQMPELALLKNKLLKYRDANIFANSIEDVLSLRNIFETKKSVIVDISSVDESLQIEVVSLVHSVLKSIEQYFYLFVSLNDETSNKKLLSQFINNDHVFTTLFVPVDFKYAKDLLTVAQNYVLCQPLKESLLFASCNTFVSQLNAKECVVTGTLTHGVPFIFEINNSILDITLEDVLGDKYQFIPQIQQEESFVSFSDSSSIDDSNVPIAETSSDLQENIFSENDNFASDEGNIKPNEVCIEQVSESVQPEQYDVQGELPVTDGVIDSSEETLNLMTDKAQDEFDDLLEETENEDVAQDDDELQESDLDGIDIQDDVIIDTPPVPVYPSEYKVIVDEQKFNDGDAVTHPRYGRGTVEKTINYGNKVLCSIIFENIGRRLLDPAISELSKL